MTTDVISPLVAPKPILKRDERQVASVSNNGSQHGKQNGKVSSLPLTKAVKPNPKRQRDLPTFPLDVGWRMQYNEQTEQWERLPLRLIDVLYPYENDKGVVEMAQSPLHFVSSSLLVEKIGPELQPQGWLVLGDVMCYWGLPGVPGQSPDLAFYYGVEDFDFTNENRSYHVGIDGPLPDFVIELTSHSTGNVDLNTKPYVYAGVGVYEFLIIDTQTPESEDWRLLGYRLGEQPIYDRIEPDAEGGVTFESVGLRFVAVRRQQIEVYEAATGRRLLTAEEQRARATTEAARAEAEASRANAEAARAMAEAARAEAETAFRAQAEAQAEQERIARMALEAQLAKTREKLRALGIEE